MAICKPCNLSRANTTCPHPLECPRMWEPIDLEDTDYLQVDDDDRLDDDAPPTTAADVRRFEAARDYADRLIREKRGEPEPPHDPRTTRQKWADLAEAARNRTTGADQS